MSVEAVSALAQALLYEGYLLYPYRTSSIKNRHRWMFGSLYPRAFAETQDEGDPWWIRTECLVRAARETRLEVRVRFLHLTTSETAERRVDTPARPLHRIAGVAETTFFEFAGSDASAGVRGSVAVAAVSAGADLFKITARVENLTPFAPCPADDREARRDAALRVTFASAHVILGVAGGAFISLVDPPDTLREAAEGCRNVGLWPVLAGEPGRADTMLAAPIILGDHPRVAPESAGDFFDATEIDEMLTLRVLTLTDEEKAAMRHADPRARAVLERTEALTEPARRRLIRGTSRTPRPGSRVRLAPRPGGDVFDLALAGRAATVVSVEADFEGRVFLAVTVDDDPGRDLGVEGKPGHRFFFRPEEVELLP